MADYSYTYDIAQLPGGLIMPAHLDKCIDTEIGMAFGTSDRICGEGGTSGEHGQYVGGTLTICFASQLSQAEKTTLDGGLSQSEENPPLAGSLLAGHCLEMTKCHKACEIDCRTRALISEGFLHNAKTFSASLNSQSKMFGLYNRKAGLTYPVKVNTIDDMAEETLADSAAVDAIHNACMDCIQGHLASGTALKNQVRAATTTADINSVVDTR